MTPQWPERFRPHRRAQVAAFEPASRPPASRPSVSITTHSAAHGALVMLRVTTLYASSAEAIAGYFTPYLAQAPGRSLACGPVGRPVSSASAPTQ